MGDNYVSAEQMGINVKAVKIKAFMFVGIGAAIAGIFTTLITYTFFPTQGFGYLLLALAVFVGGTPYWGGIDAIVGAVFGVGVIAYMEVGVVAAGMSGTWRQFFNDMIILLALLGHRLHGDRVRVVINCWQLIVTIDNEVNFLRVEMHDENCFDRSW